MGRFKETEIKLSVPISGDIRTTLSEIHFYSDIVKEWIIVPIGLRTDLGSIPQILQNIFPKDGKAMFGYIVHDWLYKTGKYSRSISDDILEEAMKVLGVGWLARKSVRNGLRVGGWVAWNNHRKNDIITNKEI